MYFDGYFWVVGLVGFDCWLYDVGCFVVVYYLDYEVGGLGLSLVGG